MSDKIALWILVAMVVFQAIAFVGKRANETKVIETGIMEIRGQKYHVIPWEKDTP